MYLRAFLWATFVGSLFLLVGSFGASLHPVADSIAVFRYWIALVSMVSVALLVHGALRLSALAIFAMALVAQPVVERLYLSRAQQDFAYSLYQKNMLYENTALVPLAQDIRAVGADFVTLQEVSRANVQAYLDLAPDFAAATKCDRLHTSSLAILSKYPRTSTPVLCPQDASGILAMQVQTPDGPLWIVNIHLRWPWPYAQPENLTKIVPILQTLQGPIVVGGDFNAVPWSGALRQVEQATGALRMGPGYKTYLGPYPFFNLPIDHVLAAPGNGRGRVETRPLLGSDHLGLWARFNLP